MSRYIDADEAIKSFEIWKEPVERDEHDRVWNSGIDACINEVKHHIPIADVVEVVRCKDCKYNYKGLCGLWSADPYEQAVVDSTDYCSFGERRGE